MAEWDREFSVDEAAVRKAAGAPRSWRLLGSGWDCDAWIADETTVWRVPRRAAGAAALSREAAVMPVLARRLPVPVPIPALVESPGLPILARHDHVPGAELAAVGERDPELGLTLGRFLRALHDPALVRATSGLLPVDPLGRGDSRKRVPSTQRRLDAVADLVDVAPLRAIVDAAAGVPLALDVVCHGDLHPRHVLVSEVGAITGVIDWGDCCIGARAVDLAIVTALSPEARARFLEEYGAVDERSWQHARLIGVLLGAVLLASDPEGAVGHSARRWLEGLARS